MAPHQQDHVQPWAWRLHKDQNTAWTHMAGELVNTRSAAALPRSPAHHHAVTSRTRHRFSMLAPLLTLRRCHGVQRVEWRACWRADGHCLVVALHQERGNKGNSALVRRCTACLAMPGSTRAVCLHLPARGAAPSGIWRLCGGCTQMQSDRQQRILSGSRGSRRRACVPPGAPQSCRRCTAPAGSPPRSRSR